MNIPKSKIKRQLRIERLSENLIDFDIVVDDARRDVDRAVEQLQRAVAARDVVAAQLQALTNRAA